jgi:hypothetical protein
MASLHSLAEPYTVSTAPRYRILTEHTSAGTDGLVQKGRLAYQSRVIWTREYCPLNKMTLFWNVISCSLL